MTKRATLVADAIRDFRITVVLHDSAEELRDAYELFGSEVPAGLKAFARDDVIHLLRGDNAFQNAVHEGIHALAWRAAEYGETIPEISLRDAVWEEIQAHSAENEFLNALGYNRGVTRSDIASLIWTSPNYRSRFTSATEATWLYFKRLGIA